MSNNDLQESRFYVIGSYLWVFMVSSLWFLVFSIPVIIAFLAAAALKNGLFEIIFLVASILIGPNLIALLYTVNKALRSENTMENVSKNYLKGIKNNFFEGMFYWVLYLAIFLIFNFDKMYFFRLSGSIKNVSYIFTALQVILIAVAIMNFVIVSRFYLKIKSAIKISLYESVKNAGVFFKILGVVVIYGVLYKMLGNAVLIIISLVSYAVIILLQSVLNDVESKFSKTDSNNNN